MPGLVDRDERRDRADRQAFKVGAGSAGIRRETSWCSEGPGTYSLTMYGRSPLDVGVQHLGGAEPRDALDRGELAQEPRARRVVVVQVGAEQLDGHRIAGLGPPEVDDALAAFTESAGHGVVAEPSGVSRLQRTAVRHGYSWMGKRVG